jgi:Nif-specific regulatory protein
MHHRPDSTFPDTKDFSAIRPMGREQLHLLYRISELLSRAGLEETLMAQILDLVISYLQAERGLFARYDQKTDHFSVVAARNISSDRLTGLQSFSSGILHQVISEKKACLYHDVQQDPHISQFKSVQIENIQSVIGVPVFHQEQIWGVILVDSSVQRQQFTNENLFFLEFLANLFTLVLDKIMTMHDLQNQNLILRRQLQQMPEVPDMIGDSPAMKKLFQLLQRVAQSDASVLLQGESGTGKELAAQAIHKLGKRRDKPFLAQFCGSIPDTLLESELFGYKKGAFSGAYADKKGLFEVTDKGTFFLDEISEISLPLQVKLLRVLENGEIISLGDTHMKKVDVRIIAATNKNLSEMVTAGTFRGDLFYRLNVFPVTLPSLRERREDIPLLVNHFLGKLGRPGQSIMPAALQSLERYSWPGNVRQLENILQRAIILSDGEKIAAEHIILENTRNPADFKGHLHDFELMLLKKRLQEFAGNRTLTARSLGVSVRWVQLKLKEIRDAGSVSPLSRGD